MNTIEEMRAAYQSAREAPRGAVVNCATCELPFMKKHPRQAFCKREGHRCKDRYHNLTNDTRRQRMLDRLSRYG